MTEPQGAGARALAWIKRAFNWIVEFTRAHPKTALAACIAVAIVAVVLL